MPPPPPPELALAVTLIDPELLPPGFGLLTVTANVPGAPCEPFAVSCVDETYFVERAAPANRTCEPLTKLEPLMVSENPPTVKEEGETLPSVGVGFQSVTLLVAVAFASAAAEA